MSRWSQEQRHIIRSVGTIDKPLCGEGTVQARARKRTLSQIYANDVGEDRDDHVLQRDGYNRMGLQYKRRFPATVKR